MEDTEEGIVTKITKEAISQYPIKAYRGPIVLVETQEVMEEVVEDLLEERVVGLDTESRPAFKKGESYPPSLIQIATTYAVYLFMLESLEDFDALIPFLENPDILKVGVAIRDDIRHLQELCPFTGAGIVELSEYSRKLGIEQTGLRNLVAILFQARLSKAAQTSNWARRELTMAQKLYAATDAWVSRELFLKMQSLGAIPSLDEC